MGVSERDGYVNFSVAVKKGSTCILELYTKGSDEPAVRHAMAETGMMGEVRFLSLPKSQMKGMEYCYEIDGKSEVDPYATNIILADEVPARSRVQSDTYDWEGDVPLQLPDDEVIAYSLHVRGFTRHKSSKVRHKGTFRGVVEKIPYLLDLGVNQIQCMPVYHFLESEQYKNYWGYGDAYCFAIKNQYASGKNPEREFKDMVKACHAAGIEVVLSMPFSQNTPKMMMVECLRYYRLEFHIDGFLLNPYLAPMDVISSDPFLKDTKILQNRDDFQFVMRRFLKGEENTVEGAIWWLKQLSKENGSYNYITNHSGFTLQDLVSYNEKHNEENGESNLDGPDYNCSCNYGAEGNTRKKHVLALRKRQVRNAFFLLLSAQGTPCILAGDEFGNSQKGNNNAYCQDNEISWLDWRQLEKEQDLYHYVRSLIAIRKACPLLHAKTPLLGVDRTGCGVPDVSYHSEYAWHAPTSAMSKKVGVYYHDENAQITDCFIAYNLSEDAKVFALPNLLKGKKWYPVFTTAEGQMNGLPEQREVTVDGRMIVMFEGRVE